VSDFHFRLESREVPRIETKHRRIVTAIPSPGTKEIMERIAKVESSNAMDQLPVVWDSAKGHQIFDRHGNAWIDFSSTIFVANCGHAHPHLVKAIQEQAAKLCHSYTYPTEIRARYLEKLASFVPDYLAKASLFSTGTEASERAIKIARLYGLKSNPARRIIVGGDGNFHGKTMGAQMAGGYHQQKHWIGYHDPNMVHMPFPYPWVMEESNMTGEQMLKKHLDGLKQKGVDLDGICAFILESYQGWGGIMYPTHYVQALRKWTYERNILMIFDECQSGFGRTGKLFCYEHYGVEADLVTCGKGVSGSLPLSVVLGRGDLIDLDPAYTSTHGGHPISCAAGLANIEIFESENLVAESARKGEIAQEQIAIWKQRAPHRVGRVLGSGLLWGVFLTDAKGDLDSEFCQRVVERCLEKGVFHISTGRGTIKLGPPLTITDEALIEGLSVTGDAIVEIDAELKGA
jgi:4-aminobutyrate aminotransferase-like enzyme